MVTPAFTFTPIVILILLTELPTRLVPNTGGPGPIGVEFHPVASGEYDLEVFVEKDGKKATVNGTPLRLDLVLPEKAPGFVP